MKIATLDNMFGKEPPLDNCNVGWNESLRDRLGGRFGYLSVRRVL